MRPKARMRLLRLLDRRRARCCHQARKQALRERIRFDHPFRMPLNARDPVRIAVPFNAFDHAIGSASDDAEISTGLENGLMMGTVDADFVCSGQFAEA